MQLLLQQNILLKLPLHEIVRNNNTRKRALHNVFVTCMQCHCYHTTPQYLKHRKSKAEPYAIKVIKPKNKLPIINIWNRMTVSELALSAQRNIDDILEAIELSKSPDRYYKNTVIEDRTLLYSAVRKLGAKFKVVSRPDDKMEQKIKDHDIEKRPPADESVLIKRHPVVTIMGHVDHGKTTLLDALRNTSVVETEFGGITQHIGAFNVTLKTGETVTFLDTPGHAAFNIMRMRGAQVTDIVVLVVAADDGVMEQTVESIEMAKTANVPILVAINKIDKHEADIERTQRMLSQQGILVEALGGDTQSVNISALCGTNLDTLTEAIALQADLIGLKGDPTGLVEAVVIECSSDDYRGKLATVLIQRGTLRKGAYLVSGITCAKVRAMFDHSGSPVTEAKLSEAVQILGWKDLPAAGDEILEVDNEKKAHMVIRRRESKKALLIAEEHKIAADKKHEEYLKEYKEHQAKRRKLGRYRRLVEPAIKVKPEDVNLIPQLNVIIKGDVAGSVEAILDIFNTYGSDDKCQLSIVHYGVGNITETDLKLAETFNAIIYVFNLNITKEMQKEANKINVSIRPYNVIYKLFDNVKKEINDILPMIDAEEVIGEANVLQEFVVTENKKKVTVAGCRCIKGILKKTGMYRLMRQQELLYTGKLISMRHLKNETETIKINVECGLRFEDPTVSFKPGDTLVCYQPYQKPQETDWDPGF